MGKRVTVLALAAVAATGAPSAAHAKFSEGEPVYTTGFNCASIIFGTPRLEHQTFVYAAQEVPDDGSVPDGDRPFYVKAVFGAVGDICGGGGNALPEFIPPAGVTVVDDPALPAYWTLWNDGVEQRASEPVVLSRGQFGGTVASVRDASDGQVKAWPYANTGGYVNVYLPLRTTRALNGIGTPKPACPAFQDSAGACPPQEAGDHLQVFTQVADGGSPSQVIPILGLFATQPTAPAPPPGGGGPGGGAAPAIGVPARVRRTALRRGFTVTVPAQARGTRVRAEARRGRRVVGRASATARSAGRPLRLRLRVRTAPPRGTRLTVRVTVTPPGAAARTVTRAVVVT